MKLGRGSHALQQLERFHRPRGSRSTINVPTEERLQFHPWQHWRTSPPASCIRWTLPLENAEISSQGSLGAHYLVPRAAILPYALKNVEISFPGSTGSRLSLAGAAVGPYPF